MHIEAPISVENLVHEPTLPDYVITRHDRRRLRKELRLTNHPNRRSAVEASVAYWGHNPLPLTLFCYNQPMDTAILEQSVPSEKDHLWQQVVEEVDNLEKKDPYGLKIDPKIKKTVIGLNALGIETNMSCEGHLDHGRSAPYINISSAEASKIQREGDNAYIMQRHVDYERFKKQSKQINERLHKKLQSYLEEFYSDRNVPDHLRLIAEFTPYDRIILRNQGTEIQKEAPQEEKAANLKGFQDEMESFGAFLEQKFFS